MKLEHWLTQYSACGISNDPRTSISDAWSSSPSLPGGYRLVSLTYRYLSAPEMATAKDKKR